MRGKDVDVAPAAGDVVVAVGPLELGDWELL